MKGRITGPLEITQADDFSGDPVIRPATSRQTGTRIKNGDTLKEGGGKGGGKHVPDVCLIGPYPLPSISLSLHILNRRKKAPCLPVARQRGCN